MKKHQCIILLFSVFFLLGCRFEIKEDRVHKEAERSLEITLDYIKHARQLHEFDLTRKIRLVNDKITRLKSKIPPEPDAKNKIYVLELEKTDLNRKLTVLIANTDASTKRITDKWNRYNQSLSAMLKNMDDYLKGIPIDNDTIPKKDSIH